MLIWLTGLLLPVSCLWSLMPVSKIHIKKPKQLPRTLMVFFYSLPNPQLSFNLGRSSLRCCSCRNSCWTVRFCPLSQKMHSFISNLESSVLLKTDSERLAVTGKLSSIQHLDLKADTENPHLRQKCPSSCCRTGAEPPGAGLYRAAKPCLHGWRLFQTALSDLEVWKSEASSG